MRTEHTSAGRDHDPDPAMDPAIVEMIECARAAEDAIRRLAHLATGRPAMTPADIDSVLAHLAETVAGLPQVATQLSSILDRSKHTHWLAMDDMTATTDPELAIDTARRHLDALRTPAAATYRHLNGARNEAAHISASPRIDAADARDVAEEIDPTASGTRPQRPEDHEPPRCCGPSRHGPAR